jgi:hypothetical protein
MFIEKSTTHFDKHLPIARFMRKVQLDRKPVEFAQFLRKMQLTSALIAIYTFV